MSKEEIKIREKQLLELTGSFCDQNLDEDYHQLCEKLILKLGRKRDVPFKRGGLEIWAAAVVHAIGSINFLFDKSFDPYVTAEQISEYFGTKKTTVSNKARQIKDILKMGYLDSDFSTKHMIQNNPLNDMIMVNGLIVPLSVLPEDLQEMVRKGRAEGKDIEFTIEEF